MHSHFCRKRAIYKHATHKHTHTHKFVAQSGERGAGGGAQMYACGQRGVVHSSDNPLTFEIILRTLRECGVSVL
jgi:hypothetical protein